VSGAQEQTPDFEWQSLAGQDVVIDTDSSYVFVGKLESATDRFVSLSNVDVHDMRDSHVTKEVYTLDTLKHGIRHNRKLTHIRLERIVCVSRLDDVVRY
jgi:hypothetical protein